MVISIKTAFNRAVRAAGLTDATPHVLRHTIAVHMAAAGVSMERIAQHLGPSDAHTARGVYARFAPDYRREETKITGLRGGRKSVIRFSEPASAS